MEKSQRVIKKFLVPALSQPSTKIKEFGRDLEKLVDKLVTTMREVKGVGLAAPQIGENLKVAVIEFSPSKEEIEKNPKLSPIPLTVLVNPKIIWHSREKIETIEGCLSLSEAEYKLRRAKEIKVLAQDIKGKRLRLRAKGLLAQVCQHEIDHLEGILVKDRGKKINKQNSKS